MLAPFNDAQNSKIHPPYMPWYLLHLFEQPTVSIAFLICCFFASSTHERERRTQTSTLPAWQIFLLVTRFIGPSSRDDNSWARDSNVFLSSLYFCFMLPCLRDISSSTLPLNLEVSETTRDVACEGFLTKALSVRTTDVCSEWEFVKQRSTDLKGWIRSSSDCHESDCEKRGHFAFFMLIIQFYIWIF